MKLIPPSHFIASTNAFVEAACLGLGWGMNPEAVAEDHPDAGRLGEVIPDTPFDTTLYWQVPRA